ncbi:MAG: ATPase [Candidatus Altiarchaeales archaeon]|nr:MAG: ATPase [Candidatus Altiarchaeales archaeon]RLI93798.1 MAG: ATPase [Candidatus Altiarchaeales archaeon]HDO81976.1 PIN domain-containing protein [Candidatus Altiarchaeales archaeon]HEX54625.1 PIN domain-containing protein [Candidatus Altiarchaeales archaeon]
MKVKIVPDTSIIVDGRISEILNEFRDGAEIIIPEVVISELEFQANRGRETGFDGLNELISLRRISEESNGKFSMRFYGKSPEIEEIKFARSGKLDELIRRVAEENGAILITSDKVQALTSEIKGIRVKYIGPKIREIRPRIFDLFDDITASIHMKENTPILAKKGRVGDFRLVEIHERVSREEIERYAKEIIERAHSDPSGKIEMEKKGVTIVQISEYRIVIARPPFSDGLEITAVRPLVKTKLSDYNLSKRLLNRLEKMAEGIFVAGQPGAGKTTFVQALAEFYMQKGKIVKTMEHPRDLQVPDIITQYSPLEGSMENTGDVLVLVRPDYTIFDEVRKTSDFKVFADMRLAGVGMIGVTHANKAIDAIQRLIGRVELGVIPHIVDTVIFIEAGKIKEVYELRMNVKIPHGMREADLARPVIEVIDFETERPLYELYSYGEEVVVIPIKEKLRRSRVPEEVEISITKKQIILKSRIFRNEIVKVFADNEYLFNAKVNRAGNIKIKRNTSNGKTLLAMIKTGKKILIK